uniref:Uncharacterized protein n=1 Tax=Arundo donax TaxID=35708 RepID=A0A0A9CY69_ARUDO
MLSSDQSALFSDIGARFSSLPPWVGVVSPIPPTHNIVPSSPSMDPKRMVSSSSYGSALPRNCSASLFSAIWSSHQSSSHVMVRVLLSHPAPLLFLSFLHNLYCLLRLLNLF